MKQVVALLTLGTLASATFAEQLDLSELALTNLDYSNTEFMDLSESIFGSHNSPMDNGDTLVRDAISNQFSYRFKTESIGLWHDGEIVATASADYGVDTNALREWSKSVDLNRLAGVDTEGATRLNMLLYRHQFQELRANLTFGLQDFSNSFYKLDATNLFAMNAFKRGPELTLPSATAFSSSAVGVQINYQFDHYYVRAATYDSSSNYEPAKLAFNTDEGLFTAIESGINKYGKLKLAAGAWNHRSGKDQREYLSKDAQYGYYVIAETKYSERAALFMQMGLSNTGLNSISGYRSAGAVIKDIFAEQDTLGVAFTKVAMDKTQVTDQRKPTTTAWEVTYRTPTLLTKDIQTSLFYQHNPYLRVEEEASGVLGLRFYRAMY
ncbi:carbohydrate porin [Halioxenophilus aromaticivorans]|uniref:Porin n=1 Tax=Halioxenophilus aromaticivorans TaxID=1306992 RepID=A0AAV3U8A5_9ALTE